MGTVQALRKPSKVKNFGDLADSFMKLVLHNFSEYAMRIDVAFDSYKNNDSIQDRNVPLLQTWNGFINFLENKSSN